MPEPLGPRKRGHQAVDSCLACRACTAPSTGQNRPSSRVSRLDRPTSTTSASEIGFVVPYVIGGSPYVCFRGPRLRRQGLQIIRRSLEALNDRNCTTEIGSSPAMLRSEFEFAI